MTKAQREQAALERRQKAVEEKNAKLSVNNGHGLINENGDGLKSINKSHGNGYDRRRVGELKDEKPMVCFIILYS